VEVAYRSRGKGHRWKGSSPRVSEYKTDSQPLEKGTCSENLLKSKKMPSLASLLLLVILALRLVHGSPLSSQPSSVLSNSTDNVRSPRYYFAIQDFLKPYNLTLE